MMKQRNLRLGMMALTLLVCFASSVLSQTKATKPKAVAEGGSTEKQQDAPATHPSATVSIFPEANRRTLDYPFDIVAMIANSTERAFTIKGVEVCVPPPLRENLQVSKEVGFTTSSAEASRKGESQDASACAKLQLQGTPTKSNQPTLRRGQQVSFLITLERRDGNLIDSVLLPRDTHASRLRVRYSFDDEPDIVNFSETAVPIEIRPSWLSITFGSFTGVFLVSAFIFVWKFRPVVDPVDAANAAAKNPVEKVKEATVLVVAEGSDFLKNIVFGVVTSVIMIILLNQTNVPQFPIAVAINDFWGGAFLGLMSVQLAQWLRNLLFAATKSK